MTTEATEREQRPTPQQRIRWALRLAQKVCHAQFCDPHPMGQAEVCKAVTEAISLLDSEAAGTAPVHYLLFEPCSHDEHSDCVEYSNSLRRDAQLTRCSCPCHRPELAHQVERDVMIETISELEKERDVAATSMRDLCVKKVKELRKQWWATYNSQPEAVRNPQFMKGMDAAAGQAVTALQSTVLDVGNKGITSGSERPTNKVKLGGGSVKIQ